MSRTTIKLKNPRMPLKATKRRVSVSSDSSSSLDLSDDEGYSAVEDLSESEDDEDNVMAAEEEHLLTRASRKRPLDSTPRPQVIVQEEDRDADEEDQEDEQNEDGDDEDEDDDEPEDDDDNAADENESWGGLSDPEETTVIEQVPEPSVISVKRHVRFAGIPDDESDSDSTTTETESNADLFPDIFVDRNELDPAFRIEIERGNESSSAESFWDYDGNPQEFFMDSEDEIPQNMLGASLLPNLTVPIPTITPDLSDSALSKAQELELDGYETDGETTEEEDPEPIIRKKQAVRVESAPVSSESEADRPSRSQRGKPRVGRFQLDGSENKPIAVFNPNSRKIMIFKKDPQAADMAAEAINDVPAATIDYLTPLLTNPGYLMMGAMVSSNTFGDFMNTQPWGPAEAFFPMDTDFYAGDDSDDSELGMDPEVDEEEAKLDIDDFLRFDNTDSEDDEELDFGPESVANSPTKKDSDKQEMHPLLNHLTNNADAVGAFRRNQINQQLILSDRATQESLSFSGPYYHGTLRGIKTGSLETVTTPITPARKRKNASMVGPTHLFLPPLFPLDSSYFKVTPSPWRKHLLDTSLNQVIAQKRKAPTTGPNGSLIDDPTTMPVHKRHRSNLSTVSELSVDSSPFL
ncbi:hypothetical protein QBC32DRAFT_224857 [Pseudoneurospora amorphoporcata]|uniref:Uncharacterized protein n=1 Tax=Pseudoneurospora amorphoporcata TaxID=241081 RepID=A0AAN6SBS0_9PEZI|nr:hypothetical protein QBC32DRAFT_224857 [Pseudoneurospora amorphoporcata]